VVDLRELEFMDSTGLRTIVAADQRARDGGRRLAIVRGPDAVDRIFTVTRLDERLEIVDDPATVA
jgi:anti-anti-sigma factor